MAVSAETVEQVQNDSASQSESADGSTWVRSALGGNVPDGNNDRTDASSDNSTTDGSTTETEQIDASSEAEQSGSDSSESDSQEQSRTFTVTEEQLERAYNQRMQAYLNSPEYKRQQQSTIDKAIAAHNKSKRRADLEAIREDRPHEYVEGLKELEAEEKAERERGSISENEFKAAETSMKQTAALFDNHILKPIVSAVPTPLRGALQEVYDKRLAPFEERSALVDTAIKLIRQDEAAKTERRLRNNQAFIKQLLRDTGEVEDNNEPDVAVGSVAPPSYSGSGNDFMNSVFRSRGNGRR